MELNLGKKPPEKYNMMCHALADLKAHIPLLKRKYDYIDGFLGFN
jgi:hypothetical protein